jgi:hypothetical protein
MRRVVLFAITAAILAITATAALAKSTLPALFAHEVATIKAAPHPAPVLLPRLMPLDAKHMYASGGASGSGYDLEIGAVKHCGGADACFVASFTATKSKSVFGKRVTVKGASKAGFKPLSCGGSCSPPEIVFVVKGYRYTIQANLNTKHGDRAALVKAAESAIGAGPR